jgi:hypothetical protein
MYGLLQNIDGTWIPLEERKRHWRNPHACFFCCGKYFPTNVIMHAISSKRGL